MARELIYAENLQVNATFVDMYKKAGKNPGDPASTNFIYKLSGSAQAIARYKEIKEAEGYYREDEAGNALFFTNIYQDNACKITITRTGATVVANNELDQMQSKLKLVTDPAVRAAAATLIAQQMFGNMGRSNATVSNTPVAAQPDQELSFMEEETFEDSPEL